MAEETKIKKKPIKATPVNPEKLAPVDLDILSMTADDVVKKHKKLNKKFVDGRRWYLGKRIKDMGYDLTDVLKNHGITDGTPFGETPPPIISEHHGSPGTSKKPAKKAMPKGTANAVAKQQDRQALDVQLVKSPEPEPMAVRVGEWTILITGQPKRVGIDNEKKTIEVHT